MHLLPGGAAQPVPFLPCLHALRSRQVQRRVFGVLQLRGGEVLAIRRCFLQGLRRWGVEQQRRWRLPVVSVRNVQLTRLTSVLTVRVRPILQGARRIMHSLSRRQAQRRHRLFLGVHTGHLRRQHQHGPRRNISGYVPGRPSGPLLGFVGLKLLVSGHSMCPRILPGVHGPDGMHGLPSWHAQHGRQESDLH